MLAARAGDIIGRAVIVFDIPWEGISADAANRFEGVPTLRGVSAEN